MRRGFLFGTCPRCAKLLWPARPHRHVATRVRATRTFPRAQIFWLIAGIVLLAANPVSLFAFDAQAGFIDKEFRDAAGTHKYVLFVPQNYTPEKKWPVILFLHGAYERGNDGKLQLSVGLGPLLKSRTESFPFLVVFPQCEDTKGRILKSWASDSTNGRRALEILQTVEKEYSVDTNHRILTGWSMGGYGAWSLAAAYPSHWSAVVPLSGGGDPATAEKLKNVPIWAFHGAEDKVIRPEESRKMISALRAVGERPRYNELRGEAHHVWRTVYDSDELYKWMLDPTVEDSETTAIRAKPGERPITAADSTLPFVPAVDIPRAVYLRLGNDFLRSVAHSVPHIMPRDMLAGSLPDIYSSTSASGRTFSIQFSRINYDAEVERAHITAYRKDRLNIQFALRNARMRIGSTFVRGRSRSAVAGPIYVVIGHRRPVWLSIDVTPYVADRRIRLKLVGTRFRIPNDNWYVSPPAGVSTRGWFMTRERVSRALVSGLYGNKARIEREILAVITPLLSRLEESFELSEINNVVSAIWPLPVFQPRVRVWPDEIATDAQGLSIAMGVTAAALFPERLPKLPRVVEPLGPPLEQLPRGTALRVGVVPQMLGPLTELLIQQDAARIHTLDIPEKKFGRFADPEALSTAIPDLKRFGKDVEVWSELVLVRPLSVQDASTRLTDRKRKSETVAKSQLVSQRDGEDSERRDVAAEAAPPAASAPEAKAESPTNGRDGQFTLEMPNIVFSLAIRTDPQSSQWTPYAEIQFHVSQTASTQVLQQGRRGRALRMDWVGDPEVRARGRFAPGYTPRDSTLDIEKIRQMFLQGWQSWTQSGPATELAVPDIDLGYAKLRLAESRWSVPHMLIGFAPPGITISNSSEISLEYETKGPYSDWGGPYVLEPGEEHAYEISHPLHFRRKAPSGMEAYTLPVGSHCDYHAPAAGGNPQLFQVPGNHPQDSIDEGDIVPDRRE
jgi:poly(3-hydroxybutyrate) depolymerase